MDKIFLIIKREYLTRVKQKTFIIMTIVGPLLMAALFVVPIFLSQVSDEERTIAIVDQADLLKNQLSEGEKLKFDFPKQDISFLKKNLKKGNYYAVLYIPSNVLEHPDSIKLFSEKQPSINVVDYLEKTIQKAIENDKLLKAGINQVVLDSVKTDISINTFKITEKGDESSSAGLTTTIGFAGGFLIYFFIFLYGAQVMRGVIEEKTSRIVEVIISSVKPFQLMMGKIVGVALVGLTQFLLWVILTFTFTSAVSAIVGKHDIKKTETEKLMDQSKDKISKNLQGKDQIMGEISEAAGNLNIPLILTVFVFYFLGGYLLYSALFAAVGAAVDSEADTQQFMLPITIPLILSFMVSQYVISNPDGPIAFWFSIIPFTSPVVMVVRIPFGVPMHEILLSMGLLILGFLCTTWFAGKIYRTGILLYGKKPTYKEITKWLFYKG